MPYFYEKHFGVRAVDVRRAQEHAPSFDVEILIEKALLAQRRAVEGRAVEGSAVGSAQPEDAQTKYRR